MTMPRAQRVSRPPCTAGEERRTTCRTLRPISAWLSTGPQTGRMFPGGHRGQGPVPPPIALNWHTQHLI